MRAGRGLPVVTCRFTDESARCARTEGSCLRHRPAQTHPHPGSAPLKGSPTLAPRPLNPRLIETPPEEVRTSAPLRAARHTPRQRTNRGSCLQAHASGRPRPRAYSTRGLRHRRAQTRPPHPGSASPAAPAPRHTHPDARTPATLPAPRRPPPTRSRTSQRHRPERSSFFGAPAHEPAAQPRRRRHPAHRPPPTHPAPTQARISRTPVPALRHLRAPRQSRPGTARSGPVSRGPVSRGSRIPATPAAPRGITP